MDCFELNKDSICIWYKLDWHDPRGQSKFFLSNSILDSSFCFGNRLSKKIVTSSGGGYAQLNHWLSHKNQPIHHHLNIKVHGIVYKTVQFV